ncbi:BLUF domain-containing protein [Sphingomonas sp. TREG-RG-20F-R18-01]|uniref:BLUF domain-containing protein n=1 Tax=Sphingomonas sp. TREG-RG-20F-R18-01 TaxID=2914982 RepID=UPI001F57899E|nr:BLUF domain-containing protein [Sphingomonas sp. TREG-RG-20F-R18-01]
MRQIIYTSITTAESGRASDDLPAILRIASARNGLDGITGLLYTEQDGYLQTIEGPEESVADLLASLRSDPRHRDIKILLDRTVEEREFGDWMMVHRERRETVDDFDRRLRRLLMGVSPETAEYFRALVDA